MTTSRSNGEPGPLGAQILIVDDEPSTRQTLATLLNHKGYRTAEAASGRQALEYLASQRFDLVILDLKMPEMDGTELLKVVSPLVPDTVFIILTAYGTLDSAIASLRHGAFDYLLKPSTAHGIMRAVEAGLAERQRRLHHENPLGLLEGVLADLKATKGQHETPSAAERLLQIADVAVDPLRRLVLVHSQPVDLTPTEFDILTYLMRHQDRVVSCRELVRHIRGYDLSEPQARAFVRSHVHRLRHKIGQGPARPCTIRVVRGSGYIISADATGLHPSSPEIQP